MKQEFKIGNFKLIQDEDGYGVMRQIEEGMFEPIATFKYPEDAIGYFYNTIMQAVAYQNSQQVQIVNNTIEESLDKIPDEEF